jgi:selenocysteine-specific elongation factor
VGVETAPNLCLGTAGHIDHGKTWLVRALTGKDTDRLPEEQERGISIDLGYAPLDLGDGRRLSLIDVPGHERFIRNMVAGATGIDLFLLVVDAGEGPRAQTHEHLAILRLLGIDRGVVAVTKADAVGPDEIAATVAATRELVPDAPVVPVSAKTGSGLDELRAALARAADGHERARSTLPTRLFVDRVFALRGIGTVATGTLWSGTVGEGDELQVLPGARNVRIRSVQVHDEPVERAVPGQRVAVSLPGVERSELRRGDALVAPGAYTPSYRLDVVLAELEPIPDGSHVHVHHGTSEVPSRVVRVGSRHAQLRLAAPVVAARDDRVVLRQETTIGGARVLDPNPRRSTDPAWLETLESRDPAEVVTHLVSGPVRRDELARVTGLGEDELDRGLAALEWVGDWVVPRGWLEQAREELRAVLTAQAERSPLDPGVPLSAIQSLAPAPEFLTVLGAEVRGGKVVLQGTTPTLGDKTGAAQELEAKLADAGPTGIKVEDADLARYLESEGRLVRLGDGHAVSPEAYERARKILVDECGQDGRISLARFRDLLGTSRRPAQLLLERFDAHGLTRRIGDERILRRSALRR